MFGHLQMWIKGSAQKGQAPQMLMLVKGNPNDTRTGLDDLPPQYSKNVRVLQHGPVTLCGTQAAQQVVAQGTSSDGKRSQIEMTSTIVKGDRYVAMYIRPVNLPADSRAEAAIHSLCPVG